MKRPLAALDGGHSGAVWKLSAPGGMSLFAVSPGGTGPWMHHNRHAGPTGEARTRATSHLLVGEGSWNPMASSCEHVWPFTGLSTPSVSLSWDERVRPPVPLATRNLKIPYSSRPSYHKLPPL